MVQSKLYLDSRFNSYSFLVLDLDACCGCHGYFPLSVHYYIALDYVKLRCRQSFLSKNLYCFGVCLSRVRNYYESNCPSIFALLRMVACRLDASEINFLRIQPVPRQARQYRRKRATMEACWASPGSSKWATFSCTVI